MRRVTLFFYLLVFVGLLISQPSSHALAQGGGKPSLRITKIETDDYPNVKVYVDGQNLPTELSELPLQLSENGKEVSITANETMAQGIQTALVLDASGSMQDLGVTGKRRYEEIQAVIEQLVVGGYLDHVVDWLSAYAPNQEGEVVSIQDWTQDHNAVRNELYLYQYPPIGVATPLFNLVYFALDRFEESKVPSHLSRSIVLFSDGDIGESSLRFDDAVDRAVKANVSIHTIMLGEGTPETIGNMTRLATLTGGQYIQITSDEALNPLWERIAGARDQYQLTYRSQLAQPREVLISATLEDGDTIQAVNSFPTVGLTNVEVELKKPAGDLIIKKEASAHDTPLRELQPKEIDIEVELNWSDGFSREVSQVEYVINDITQVRNEAPFDRISFPIDTLDAGRYTIRAVVTDELGLEGEARPFSFEVQVERPPAPLPPTAEPQSVSVSVPLPGSDDGLTVNQNLARNIISLTALILAILAVIIAMRNPARRKQVTEAFGAAVKQVTQPFFPNREDLAPKPVKAILSVMEGDGKLPPSIEIRGMNVKLGRSPELANIVIDDPRISRYHCRITEEADGYFRIWDEGSTSGTYLNSVQVDLTGQTLKNGDLINLGPMQFQFRYVGDQYVN